MDRQWNLERWYDYCRNYKRKKEKRRQRYWKQNRDIPMELRNGMTKVANDLSKKR